MRSLIISSQFVFTDNVYFSLADVSRTIVASSGQMCVYYLHVNISVSGNSNCGLIKIS